MRFVGRDRELARLEQFALGQSASRVLYLRGLGGVGKTTLLRALADRCEAADMAVTWLDGHASERVAASLRELSIGAIVEPESPQSAADPGRRQLVIVDAFEHLHAIEDWLREDRLRHLPDSVRVVIAGRERLDPRWLTDLALGGQVAVLPLMGFDQEGTCVFLASRGVASEYHQALWGMTHGHPLALAMAMASELAMDLSPSELRLEALPAIAERLLEEMVPNIPDRAHRTALELCALAPATNECLLRRRFDQTEAQSLFEWLRHLAAVETAPSGLVPDDLLRDLVVADLRWRDPAEFRALAGDVLAWAVRRSADEHSFVSRLVSRVAAVLESRPSAAPPPIETGAPSMSRQEFIHAVRDALRRVDRPDLLVDSPLLNSRIVSSRADANASELSRAQVLAETIRNECRLFLNSPNDRDHYRVLERTHLMPAVKQRAAAAELSMSWSSYRRTLYSAVRRLAESLWWKERDLGGGRG